jgi:hypothetical protein
MSSDSKAEPDTPDNTNSVPENEGADSEVESNTVENSIPGFELPLTAVSISLVLSIRRKMFK